MDNVPKSVVFNYHSDDVMIGWCLIQTLFLNEKMKWNLSRISVFYYFYKSFKIYPMSLMFPHFHFVCYSFFIHLFLFFFFVFCLFVCLFSFLLVAFLLCFYYFFRWEVVLFCLFFSQKRFNVFSVVFLRTQYNNLITYIFSLQKKIFLFSKFILL